jgi:hypothetical protein
LKSKKDQTSPGIITKTRTPDEHNQSDEDDPKAGHLAAAEALIAAVKSGHAQGVADALQDAFTMMDSEPHEEGEHTNKPSPHTYDSQNQLAAKDNE